ncbi:MAG: DNA alkylation repair protein [Candidatus Hydrogenedentes bacterium]|nr:DNA alkylation repair protein [Candidatus Hydrogenedentota bacterium]
MAKVNDDTFTRSRVMGELESMGKPNTAKTYGRHGVTGETFGVSYADLGDLHKRIGTNHALALELWKSKVHDAQVLATKVADSETMTKAEINGWVKDAGNYVITDAISALAARMKAGLELSLKWIDSKDEWTSAAGWGAISVLAMNGALDVPTARQLLKRIVRDIHSAKNRTRHTMNSALIAIGGAMDELREEAIAAARSIGKVEVDHGETGCETPDAIAYIQRMAARPKRKRSTPR